jgi:glucokinase
VVRQIAGLITGLSRASRRPPAAVGLGVPGFIDHRRGVVLASPNFPDWTGFRLAFAMKKVCALPVAIENDANCAALGEGWKGALRGVEHGVCFTLGTGVGGGIIANGSLLRGFRGAGAEIGHIPVEPEGPLCGCGSRGCLETLASGEYMRKRHGRSAEELAGRARAGDEEARKAFASMGRYLGIGCAAVCSVLDPERIAFGGRLAKAFDLFGPALRAELAARLPKHPARNVKLIRARTGDDAGRLGAARTALLARS